ncbi:hypothetical protein U1Q18_003930 [Sarracenia purpurea var. burkii]
MDVLRLKPGVLAVNKQTLGSAAKSRKHPSSCCHLSTLHSQAKSAEEKNIEMVSDSDLAYRLWEVLRTADLNTTTASAVRRALEEEFGIDLSNRKPFIRDQIDLFLDSQLDDKDGVAGDRVGDNAKEEVDEEGPENVKPDDDGDSGSEEDEQSDGKKSEKGRSDKVDNIVKKSVWAFSKPCALSPRLQTFVGVSELARPEVVKKIWAYIRENNLQDPKNKQKILCDEPLRALFRVNSIDMFQMSKALSKHMWPLNEEDGISLHKPSLLLHENMHHVSFLKSLKIYLVNGVMKTSALLFCGFNEQMKGKYRGNIFLLFNYHEKMIERWYVENEG